MSETKLSKTQKKNLKKRGKKTEAGQLRENVYGYLANKMDQVRAQQMTDDFATDGALASVQSLREFIAGDGEITIRKCNLDFHVHLEDALDYAVQQQELREASSVAVVSAMVSVDDMNEQVVKNPSLNETENALVASDVLKSDGAADTGNPPVPCEQSMVKDPVQGRGAQQYDLEQEVLQTTHRTTHNKAGWHEAFTTAVLQIHAEFDLQISLEKYAATMCRLGQAMLARQVATKATAILKNRETRAKYKAMKQKLK